MAQTQGPSGMRVVTQSLPLTHVMSIFTLSSWLPWRSSEVSPEALSNYTGKRTQASSWAHWASSPSLIYSPCSDTMSPNGSDYQQLRLTTLYTFVTLSFILARPRYHSHCMQTTMQSILGPPCWHLLTWVISHSKHIALFHFSILNMKTIIYSSM